MYFLHWIGRFSAAAQSALLVEGPEQPNRQADLDNARRLFTFPDWLPPPIPLGETAFERNGKTASSWALSPTERLDEIYQTNLSRLNDVSTQKGILEQAIAELQDFPKEQGPTAFRGGPVFRRLLNSTGDHLTRTMIQL